MIQFTIIKRKMYIFIINQLLDGNSGVRYYCPVPSVQYVDKT